MQRENFNDLFVFVTIARVGSFTRAAAQLGVSQEGAVNVMWVTGEGDWNGPVRLSAHGYAIPGTHLALAHQSSLDQLDAFFMSAGHHANRNNTLPTAKCCCGT